MNPIFINLPVEDPQRSRLFYHQIGFADYPPFTGEKQVCVSWGEQVFVMLQTASFFQSGHTKSTADASRQISASFTLPVGSLEQVREKIEKGREAGGTVPGPIRDEGFMQVGIIEDPDGHTWSFIHLDMEAFQSSRKA